MKLHKVEVEWVDSHSFSHWMDRATRVKYAAEDTLRPLKSTGFLLSKKNGVVILTNTYDAVDDTVLDTLVIPKGCVKSIRRIG